MEFVNKNTDSVSMDVSQTIGDCLNELGIKVKNRTQSKSVVTEMQKDLKTLMADLKTHVIETLHFNTLSYV